MLPSLSSYLRPIAGRVGRYIPASWRQRLESQPFLLVVVPLVVAGLVVRLNNAWRYPALHGFDSYAHATYIWHVLSTWSAPLATDGWGRFHPPLYYTISAMIWWPLQWLEPQTVLRILNVIFGAAGLGSGLIAASIVRRRSGQDSPWSWAAFLFVLYLPVHIYTAPMVGNEGLSTVLCSVAVLFLVILLDRGGLVWAACLGAALGLALLTKFTAVIVFGASTVTLALWGLLSGRWKTAALRLFVVCACMLPFCGWFYARNAMLYGNPFQMSRDFFATKRIESTIPRGQRDLESYLGFDLSIFRHPSYSDGPILDSVWTGVYATAWFDAHGGWFMPDSVYDSMSYKVGRIMMVLGIVPTLLILVGLLRGIIDLRKDMTDPVLLTMVTTTACMLGMFVIYTFENRIFTAVKASYMLPAIVPFAFWFAMGLRETSRLARWAADGVVVALVGCAAFIVPVYSYGVVFEVPLGAHHWNSVAVLEYLAGFTEVARPKFEAVAEAVDIGVPGQLYLAHENLASIALDEGEPLRALVELRKARSLVPAQVLATESDVPLFLERIDAEYWNSLSVIYEQLQWSDLAMEAAQRSVALDPNLPEAHYDLGVMLLRRGEFEAAANSLRDALRLDPGFADSHLMLAYAESKAGDCESARSSFALGQAAADLPRRSYPYEAGTGELHDAAVRRRRHIQPGLDARAILDDVARCRSAADSGERQS